VDQAGGALTWDGNSHMRSALVAAAEKSAIPTLVHGGGKRPHHRVRYHARGNIQERNVPHKLVIYESFTPSQGGRAAPGHALFSMQGARLWESDVIEFLGRYLK